MGVDESTVQVQNTAQDKDGTPSLEEGSPFEFLRAIVPDPEEPAKLAVGPPNLPPETYGSYWVVAAGSATRRPRNDISYCVRASYKLVDESTVQVQNTAQDKDGTPSLEEGSPFEFLRAIVP